MKNRLILLLIIIIQTFASEAQINSKEVCRVENGMIIFKLDLRWNAEQKKNVSERFDIDSTIVAGAFQGKQNISFHGSDWKTQKVDSFFVELYKPIDSTAAVNHVNKSELFMLDDPMIGKTSKISIEPTISYGVNYFTRKNIIQYSNGKAIFYLPNHVNSKRVYLSGTFNNWSTMQNPMQACDSGWIISLPLEPGKYLYKYIIDGNWFTDPFNKIKEKYGNSRIYNSVLYCENHLFKLSGYANAKKVIVAGNFNDWNTKELKMEKTSSGWQLPVFLKEGTYAYKFIVDNVWINDPANKIVRKDGYGNQNSYFSIGDTLIFQLKGYTNAGAVFLAGNFNSWNRWELLMDKVPGGWELPYVLAAGNYEYKFIVDGKWMIDSSNLFTTESGDYQNSILCVKPNHTFELKGHLNASKVILAGSFNGWKDNGYHMVKLNDKWIFNMYLKPGKYTYKFIVDGNWIIDPGNELWEINEYNGGNSVLWIEP